MNWWSLCFTFGVVYIFTNLSWGVDCKSVAMDYILAANARANKKIPFYEGDIKRDPDRKHSSGDSTQQNAAVSCANRRVECNRLWDGAVIPYSLHASLRRHKEANKVIKEGMTEWETKTCIRFVNRTNEEDYVEFESLDGCNADVGRKKGRQSISLGDGCLHKGVVIHEIGHVIGFWHEQNRPDRDNFVTVYTDNILDGYKEAFAKFSEYRIDSRGIKYDYESVMHYSVKAFSKNGKPTIRANKRGVHQLGNTELSPLDIEQTNLVYGCDKINRGWTSWSYWTSCSKTCGGGEQKKTRVCTSLKDGEPQCPGANVEKRICNTHSCPEWPDFPGNFSFRDHRSADNLKCVLIYERADYQDWNHYFFCSEGERDTEMSWSDNGARLDWKCTNIFEPREPANRSWFNNYLCVQKHAPYNFTWSHSGPIPGLGCIQWYAKQGRDGWDDNYLCAEVVGKSKQRDRPSAINGNWGSWGSWSICSRQCNGGKKRRLRQCNNPAPKFGGKICRGKYFADASCNTKPCEEKKCGGKLKGSKGEFTSPNYPRDYPNEQNCTWIIKGDPKKRIILHFKSFSFESAFADHLECQFDYLNVKQDGRNGKDLGTFCGTAKPSPIASESNILWVNMITDKTDTRAGFRITWETIDSKPEGCGGDFNSRLGTITSPDFPNKYPHKKTCIWNIQVPKGKVVSFDFTDFDVEPHGFCKYDYVEIRDGWEDGSPQLGRYCTNRPPRDLISTQNQVRIKFVTDETTAKTGFKLKWKSIRKNTVKSSARCHVGWKLFPNTRDGPACYIVKNNYFSWMGARDDCLANGADLLSISSRDEQEFVTRELLKGKFMWLGYTDKDYEGRWAWSDNSTVHTFTNWDGGDPNDGGWLRNEDCALMKPDGKWNDYPCNDQFKYICKRKPLRI